MCDAEQSRPAPSRGLPCGAGREEPMLYAIRERYEYAASKHYGRTQSKPNYIRKWPNTIQALNEAFVNLCCDTLSAAERTDYQLPSVQGLH